MTASQSGVFSLQQFSDVGAPLVGGRLYTLSYGTTTHKTAYTDKAGTIAHTYTSDGASGQYIALNARGELPAPLYLTYGSYDIALKRADGSTVWTRRADPLDADLIPITRGGTGATDAAGARAALGAAAATDTVGRLIGVRVITSSSTYTPTTGTASVIVEAVGGGGGSGGTTSTSSTQFSISAGGGGGSYGRARFTSAFSGVTVTVGAGGIAGTSGGGNGGNGGTTSFGALLSCPGGGGGNGAGVVDSSNTSVLAGGVGGTAPAGANIHAVTGEKAAESWQFSVAFACRGSSGRSAMSTAIGQDMFGNSASIAGNGYGGGAAGGFTALSGASRAGAAGAPGVVIVYEYA